MIRKFIVLMIVGLVSCKSTAVIKCSSRDNGKFVSAFPDKIDPNKTYIFDREKAMEEIKKLFQFR